ncbi:MAG TPA: acyltransferase [Pirellulales bacterium]
MLTASPRYQSLDLWRGIACLSVVLVHSTAIFRMQCPLNGSTFIWLTSFGEIGVPIFFVISGYCISAIADSTRIKNQSVKTYFARRFRRIYPPYWIAMLFGVVAFFVAEVILRTRIFSEEPLAQYGPRFLSLSQWLGNLTLTETWRPHIFGEGQSLFIQQAWTLCYEEQFYFVVGMLLLCARHRFFSGIVAITIGVISVKLVFPSVTDSGFFFNGQWFTFASGVAIYYAINYLKRGGRAVILCLLMIAGMLGLVFPWWLPYRMSAAIFFGVLLLILHPLDSWIYDRKFLSPLMSCGRMCYSLYLVHELVVTVISRIAFNAGLSDAKATIFIVVPLCVIASLGTGWLFHICIERRFLNAHPALHASCERRFATIPTLLVGQVGSIVQSAARN